MAEPKVLVDPAPKRAVCECEACVALLAECGPELFPLYSKKLLRRGWAGKRSPAENGYVKAHRP